MLDSLNRKSLFADLKRILGVRSWTAEQVAGLDRLLDGFTSDALVPAGKVGVQRVAYWLFTDWIETGHTFTPIMERGSAAYFLRRYGPKTRKGRELGNETDDDAILLRGAGDVQLTGKRNREAAEELIRRNYPEMVAAWERANGRVWDLTIGDQPNDRDDWKNALVPQFSYAIMVAGTTEGLFGPPINRYINTRRCDYGGARHCVNGTDRADEFAATCPKIETALNKAIAVAGSAPPERMIDSTPLPSSSSDSDSAAPRPVVDAPAVAGDTTNTQNIENAGVVLSAPDKTPVPGGGPNDPAVLANKQSLITKVATWAAGTYGVGFVFDQVTKVTGLSPEAQVLLIGGIIAFGIVGAIIAAVDHIHTKNLRARIDRVNVR
jgi:hypothetical protein